MAKQKSGKARQRARKSKSAQPQPVVRTRQEQISRWGLIVAAVAGLALLVWWGTGAVQADLAEQDLARVGQGVPAIVQVHDPNCAPCADLQRETRAALKSFDDNDVTYLVASLTTAQGQVFAGLYGASYATLLFFDDTGELTNTVRGPSDRNTLTGLIAAHIEG